MAKIKPFSAIRPVKGQEQFAKKYGYENIVAKINSGDLHVVDDPGLYVYRLEWPGHVQTVLVACLSVDDYMSQVIKGHENAVEKACDKMTDNIAHFNVQMKPAFIGYHQKDRITEMNEKYTCDKAPIFEFDSDGVHHTVWNVDDFSKVANYRDALAGINELFIVGNEEAAASSVMAALQKRTENPDYTGDEDFNYFLAVLGDYDEIKTNSGIILPPVQENLLMHCIGDKAPQKWDRYSSREAFIDGDLASVAP